MGKCVSKHVMRALIMQVLIQISVKSLDILACKGKYQEKSKPPFTPGLEVSGEISECCNCNRLKVGDRVFCIFTANGAFSEECVVNENQCFLVPSVRIVDVFVTSPFH